MSDASRPDDGIEDDDLLAAEYVLGVLDADACRRLERRLRREPALERRVEDWETRLAPMLEPVKPASAPPAAWNEIERRLDRMVRFRSPPGAPVAPESVAARFWKWFGLGSFGLLAASLAALFVVTQPRVGAPPMAAVIAPAGGAALYAAVVDARTHRATLIPIAVPALDNRTHELWMIGKSGEPRSLGLLPAAGPMQMTIAPEMLAGAATLAVSEEPPGGSPTGKPTGPVVGTGALRQI